MSRQLVKVKPKILFLIDVKSLVVLTKTTLVINPYIADLMAEVTTKFSNRFNFLFQIIAPHEEMKAMEFRKEVQPDLEIRYAWEWLASKFEQLQLPFKKEDLIGYKYTKQQGVSFEVKEQKFSGFSKIFVMSSDEKIKEVKIDNRFHALPLTQEGEIDLTAKTNILTLAKGSNVKSVHVFLDLDETAYFRRLSLLFGRTIVNPLLISYLNSLPQCFPSATITASVITARTNPPEWIFLALKFLKQDINSLKNTLSAMIKDLGELFFRFQKETLSLFSKSISEEEMMEIKLRLVAKKREFFRELEKYTELANQLFDDFLMRLIQIIEICPSHFSSVASIVKSLNQQLPFKVKVNETSFSTKINGKILHAPKWQLMYTFFQCQERKPSVALFFEDNPKELKEAHSKKLEFEKLGVGFFPMMVYEGGQLSMSSMKSLLSHLVPKVPKSQSKTKQIEFKPG